MEVPLSQPEISEADIAAVVAVLRGARLSLGPAAEAFEQVVAEAAGVEHGVAVSSGTAGLHLCVRALGLGPGDEVIVPSFTFVAAANAIRYEGATPVFADVLPGSLNMDPERVEAAISPRTRALMVVHTFGVPARMDQLMAVAERHGLRVIEDACEAIGAEFAGKRVGSFGDAAVFAFYPNKQVTTGEGGVIATRDAALARECRALRNQGRYATDDWHQHSVLGFNYRMSEINCALGVSQMARLGEVLERRAAVAALYDEELAGSGEVLRPALVMEGGRLSWFVYVIRIEGADAGRRDRVAEALMVRGVQCGRYFAPVHQQGAYGGYPVTQPLTVTEEESQRTLALPFFTAMRAEQVAFVCEQLRLVLAAEPMRPSAAREAAGAL